MNTLEEEIQLSCPYCGGPVSMVFDQYSGSQQYVEDCEVCCRPIQITYEIEDYKIIRLETKRLED